MPKEKRTKISSLKTKISFDKEIKNNKVKRRDVFEFIVNNIYLFNQSLVQCLSLVDDFKTNSNTVKLKLFSAKFLI